jgi:hypothetical protein
MRLRGWKNGDFLLGIFLVFLIFFIFKAWFSFGFIAANDWEFFHFQNLKERLPIPFLWNNDGLGRVDVYRWATPYFNLLTYSFVLIRFPWSIIEKIIWPWPFLVLIIFSSCYLAKICFPKNSRLQVLTPLIYLFNTYILMIVGGGQMGIALAYALAPLVLALFLRAKNSSFVIRDSIFVSLAFALQIMFDPRISLLTAGAIFLYAIFQYGLAIKKYLETFILPILITFGLHLYWLLPALLLRRPVLPAGYGEAGWVEFLSFGNFSDSLSLLHPNWPENIFGKVYFMRPEFLIIPVLAFTSLLFLKKLKVKAKREVLFFAFLALIGAFLAKGSKPPFGEIYSWLFRYFPGMNLFRDPTKFYLFVALSYSILIPFSLEQIIKRFKRVFSIKYLVLCLFLLSWLFLIRPAWLDQLGGTFKARELPPEYTLLKDFIHDQKEFFRTFWIPKRQIFGFFSNNHPAIEGAELPSEKELAEMGVKYVIIPFDSEGEIFLEDRQYSPEKRIELEEKLDQVSWLEKIEGFGKIAAYQTPGHRGHFFVNEERPSISWVMINPTKYSLQVKDASQPFELYFSETYDELWQAKIGEKIIPSTEFEGLNSFTIDQTGEFEVLVEFAPQKYVYWGLALSGLTALLVLFLLKKNENKT